MTRPRDLAFNRPGLAALNLFTSGPGAAATAIFNPEALTPEEGKTLAERWGVDGLAGGVLNAVTDPLVLFSLVTSFRFPIPRAIRWVKNKAGMEGWEAENFFDLAPKFAKEAGKMGESAPWMMKFRSLHSNFRGSAVPGAVDSIIEHRVGFLNDYLPRFGAAIEKWEAATGRAWTMKDQVLLTAKLEGLDKRVPRGFSSHFKEFGASRVFKELPNDEAFTTLAADWRSVYDDMWDAAFKDESGLRAILRAQNKAQRTGLSKKKLAAMMGRKAAPLPDPDKATAEEIREYFKKKENYVPHYPSKNMTEFMTNVENELRQALMAGGGMEAGTREGYQHYMKNEMLRQAARSAYKRTGIMLPALDDLELVKEHVEPGALEAVRSKIREQTQLLFGGSVPKVTEYTMRAADAASTYTHAAATMNAWTVKEGGNRLFDALHHFESTGQHMRAKMLRDTYIPALLGRMTYDQANRSQMWTARVKRWYDWLDNPDTFSKHIPEGIRSTLKGMLLDDRGNPTLAPMNRTIAGYLYTSALGANPASAVRNLFQLTLTTGPVLGAKYTGIGIEKAMTKAGKYYNMRAQGLTHQEAFAKAFAEYQKAGISHSPVIDETVGRSLSSVWDRYANPQEGFGLQDRSELKKLVGKGQQALMALFSTSENAVRLVTFEGAMAKGLKDASEMASMQGVRKSAAEIQAAAVNFARRAVEETQFVSGLSNTPYALIDKSPVWRQFMHFGARLTEFATDTSWKIGAGMPGAQGVKVPGLEWLYSAAERKGLNPGTFARMVLWSELAGRLGYEALGVDLSQSLITGALPTPKGMGAFAPWSLLPPAASLIGAPALDIARGRGDWEETKKALPLLLPGGIGGMRALGVIPGAASAAKAFGVRNYVDYKKPTPDGRYPVFTPEGNLVSYMTMGQIFLMGTGMAEGGSAFQTEQDLYRFLIANRDRIRETKRNYVQSVVQGDIAAADAIDQDFQQSLPGVGTMRDWVSENDFENEHTRRTVTRLEKILDTLPPQVRPMYAQALQSALMASGNAELLGLNTPQGLQAAPTSRGRAPYRPPAARQPVVPYQNNMSPLKAGQIDSHQISFGPYTTGPISGFASFAR